MPKVSLIQIIPLSVHLTIAKTNAPISVLPSVRQPAVPGNDWKALDL